ncbi:hypothetical protein DPMN_111361 [Dreissena polymorpha]|uniref:Uncharacterized protein n=1 Tax=Dreissena polymorpha TaxID=45954 RepID=A0A9D4KER7_DREPO|nr:hypothetical protein DPMN_111361 [Dreissena polymorpha]
MPGKVCRKRGVLRETVGCRLLSAETQGRWNQEHENRDHCQIVPISTRYDDNNSNDNYTHSDNSDNYDNDSDEC